jgi:hypothetical protein
LSKRERERGEINDRFEREETQLVRRKEKKLCFCGFIFESLSKSGEYFKDGGRVIGALITATGEP